MRIAITTDWLTTLGGAERVIMEMINIWPEAELFTTVHNDKAVPPSILKSMPLHTSCLQGAYKLLRSHRVLLPMMPRAVESWDLRKFDIVLSSSHAIAKGCLPMRGARHICYCHTPMRYAWEMEEEYLSDFGLKGPLKALAKRELKKLREWDYESSKRVDLFIANSRTTQERIKKYYGRESTVLHPPVHDRFFVEPLQTDTRPGGQATSYLTVGRLVPYKRFDLLITVANQMALPLTIIGNGPDLKRLEKMAGPTVRFTGRLSEADLIEAYGNARAVIFPAYEDAGIVPLEAQALGVPVIALGRGGALDTVIDDVTGVLFHDQSVESLSQSIDRFELLQFDPEKLREHAKKFSGENFRNTLKSIINTEVYG